MKPNCYANIAVGSSAAVDQNGIAATGWPIFNVSVQAEVTGTSTGVLKLQASNDPLQTLQLDSLGNAIPINWSDVPSATVAIAGAGIYLIPFTQVCYRWIRCKFVHTNGATGTIVANMNTQGF